MVENENIVDVNLADNEFLEKEKEKKILMYNMLYGKTCNNFIFVFIFYFIESIISIGCFYIFYLFKFGDKSKNISKIIEFISLGVISFFYLFPCCIFKYVFDSENEKLKNIMQFILINIHKICFFVFIYLLVVLNGNDRISFSHFEARAYWKISMSLLYFSLIIYTYYKRYEIDDTNYAKIYLLFSIISLLIYFFLTLFTQRNNDNWDRLWIYLIFMFLEITFSLLTIGLIKAIEIRFIHDKVIRFTVLEWKINEIDYYKYFLLGIPSLLGCFENCRFCKRLKENFFSSKYKK